jgi:cell wall-associated NlpC family hydrolase
LTLLDRTTSARPKRIIKTSVGFLTVDAPDFQDIEFTPSEKPAFLHRRGTLLGLAATALVVPGLVASVLLPTDSASASEASTGSIQTVTTPAVPAQELTVAADAPVASAARGSFSATSPKVLAARKAAKAAKAAAAASASVSVASSGASVASLLANPPQPNFSLSAVVAAARKYTGVPYVFGGASPSGFDCSGLTMYVYAQFGIALPHSASAQGSMGTRIAPSAARPGDLIVMAGGSHVGIYLGGNMMFDAPEPGRTVGAHAIWTSDYYFVRFGI